MSLGLLCRSDETVTVLDNQSTNTSMEVEPDDGGSFSMKSMEIEFSLALGYGVCFSTQRAYDLWLSSGA